MKDIRINFKTPLGLVTVDCFLVWTSVHGKKERICNMSNGHLFNLFWYLFHRAKAFYMLGRDTAFDVALFLVVRQELKDYRKEPDPIEAYDPEKDPLFKALQRPYKNPQGEWEIWDFKTFRPKTITDQEAQERLK